jgi:rhamnose utilization protein RhaD (predicted bifunctional aldolase and dehydrogenase)/NAD(P)-dependent dehydrogenase (short-subunit alcohol dehydrogenase family)
MAKISSKRKIQPLWRMCLVPPARIFCSFNLVIKMIQNLWSDSAAAGYIPRYINPDVALRIYTSHLLGREPRLVLHGGGNTSVKTIETDLLGNETAVLRVKGSGWDLASIEPVGLPAVRLEPLLKLEQLEQLTDEAMVNYLRGCLMDSSAPTPSVETLLHAFLPHKYIDHSHALDVLALVDQDSGDNIPRQVFGGRVGYVPYIMPGFSLAKAAASVYRRNLQVEGLLLMKHGLFTFGDSARQSYTRTIELSNLAAEFVQKNRRTPVFVSRSWPEKEIARQADVAPILRGCLANSVEASSPVRWILDFRTSDQILEFVSGRDLAEYANRGTVTPDHLIRTKAKPLILSFPVAGALAEFRRATGGAVADYVGRYQEYFDRNNSRLEKPKSPLDSVPRIAVVPGCGFFGIGKSAGEAAVVADIAETWIEAVTSAEAIGRFCSLDESRQFEMEYWSLEQAKLRTAPEPRLARQVVLITGGAGTIGRAIGRAFAREGAEVALADLDGNKADEVARGIKESAFGAACDVTDAESVKGFFDRVCERFGGADIVVSNAGAAWSGPIATISDNLLRNSFELNFFAHQLVAQNAVRVMRWQETGGAILFNISKQAINPGPNFGAYGIPKAATLALARQYALEHGRDKIRVNVVNADRIRSGLLTDDMIRSRAQSRGLTEKDYMSGNLLGCEVTAEDVAQAFVNHALALKTTGDVTTVDGGNVAAFLR